MKSFWHPLSTILFADPPCWATPALLKIFLAPGGSAGFVYAGDRMWPTLRHGDRFEIEGCSADVLEPGDGALAVIDGVPDLLRVVGRDNGGVRLCGDSDSEESVVEAASILGRTALAGRPPGPRRRRVRRFLIDLGEAWNGRPEHDADPATSVLAKYDAQAAFYARGSERLEETLRERVLEAVRPGGRLLVVGSGAGNECFALAADGFEVSGVDFSPAMIEHARKDAAARELTLSFRTADVRTMNLEPRSLDGILFTYDVYSFLPDRGDRIEVLRKLSRALAPGGALLLSARRRSSAYQALILTVQWLAARGRGPGEWGCSHTRWIATDGALRRSFVQVFARERLEREIRAGGFDGGPWLNGHACLHPR